MNISHRNTVNMTTHSRTKLYDAMRDTILIGIHQKNFRNGAFKTLILKDTPVVDAMNILIESSQLSSSEKDIVRSCRDEFIAYRARYPGDPRPDIFEAIKLMVPTEKLIKMFNDDAKSQGLHVSPCVAYSIEDGKVKKISVLNDDGSTADFETGIDSPAWSAEWLTKSLEENMGLFTDASKKSAAQGKFLF
jgi:hypothetical protein